MWWRYLIVAAGGSPLLLSAPLLAGFRPPLRFRIRRYGFASAATVSHRRYGFASAATVWHQAEHLLIKTNFKQTRVKRQLEPEITGPVGHSQEPAAAGVALDAVYHAQHLHKLGSIIEPAPFVGAPCRPWEGDLRGVDDE